jgi:hypothetical protein
MDDSTVPHREVTLGEMAFKAYNEDRGGVNHQGNKTPEWDELPEEIRHAWEVGADAVAGHLLNTLGRMRVLQRVGSGG